MAPPTQPAEPWICPGCGRRRWHLYLFPTGVCKECLKKIVSPREAGDRRDVVDFSWLTALLKGFRAAALTAAVVAGSSFFGAFDEMLEWTQFGVPEWLAMLAVMGFGALWDWLKRWLKAQQKGAKLRHRWKKR